MSKKEVAKVTERAAKIDRHRVVEAFEGFSDRNLRDVAITLVNMVTNRCASERQRAKWLLDMVCIIDPYRPS